MTVGALWQLPIFIKILLLGTVQGITEWLPVSSSGHLVIAKEFLGLETPVAFDVMLHLATLIVVVVFFRKEIQKILKAVGRLDFKSHEGKMGLFIVLGSIPAVVVGYLFHDFFVSLFSNLLAVAVSLIITGFVLFISKIREGKRKLNFLDSLIVGIAQAAAIAPGISRSGMTISAGLLRKVKKEDIFTFSFLLSIPAIIGASISEIGTLSSSGYIAPMIFGMVAAAITGYFSLTLLRKIVIKNRFHLFAYYCWALGVIIILLFFS